MAYEQGDPSIAPGTQQLPQGGASQANAQSVAPADPLTPDLANPPVIMAPREEEPIDEDDRGLSENLQILAAPPEANWAPNPTRTSKRVPPFVVRSLPVLMAAARDPEAPRSIKATYRAMVAAIEAE